MLLQELQRYTQNQNHLLNRIK